jgi:hypothetical protein
VALAEGMLSVELVKVEGDWLWCSGMTGNMLEVGFGYFGRLGLESVEGRMRISLVMWSPLHCVVDFSGCGLMQRLCRILLNFLFRLKIDGAIFCVMVGFIAMIHAVWWFHCVWASAAPQAMVQSSASLVVLGDL